MTFVYTGTLAGGLFVHRFNASGTFSPIQSFDIERASYLAVSPSSRTLLAVTHTPEFEAKPGGGIVAYRIDASAGGLKRVSAQHLPATHAAFVGFDRSERFALVACTFGGAVVVVPLGADAELGAPLEPIRHPGKALVAMGETTRPNLPPLPEGFCLPHSIWTESSNQTAFVPDLGLNRVFVYRFDAATGRLEPGTPTSVAFPPASGPRHLSFHPNFRTMYVLNEIGSTISVLRLDSNGNVEAQLVQTLSTLPAGYDGESTASDLHVHPSGRFLFSSNRGHNSISVFQIDDETQCLTLIDHTSVEGSWPRAFRVDTTGTLMVAANQHSNNLVAFSIDAETGRLQATGELADIPAPTCVLLVHAEQLGGGSVS